MQLHDVHRDINKRKKRKRIGRGTGSGHGKTASKGHKGHSSRQGFKQGALFEGGQIPLARRLPKRGFFNSAFKKDYAIVNLSSLESRPARRARWEYVFWVDVDAATDDPACAAALDDLRAETEMVRVLGSYPRAADD